MNKSIVRCLIVGSMGAMGWANGGQAVLADEPEATPQITVYVNNYAQVEPETLTRAKEVAARIFGKSGVEAIVLDPLDSAETIAKGARFFVSIFPRQMAERLGLPANHGGVAPGTPNEQNRRLVYVFDHVAERLAREQVMARVNGKISRNADKAQILGHAMAHEIGHVLLHEASHSPVGLMRANWDRDDLQNMVAGDLVFTPNEAERVRAEIRRRNARGKVLTGSKE